MKSVNPWAINNLKAVRINAGYTQKQVSDILGKALENRLSRWEQGQSVPSVFNLLKLCKLYKVTVEEVYPEVLLRSEIVK